MQNYLKLKKKVLSSLRGAWAFDEIRRYHTRPLRFNWGPENVHFGETHFRDPNIDIVKTKKTHIDRGKKFSPTYCG